MSTGIFGIGVSAIQAAQIGLATTSHNIANASTPGFNRQRVLQNANIATLTGGGYVGTGTYVATVERIYDKFLSRQVQTAQTTVSALDEYSTMIGELNTLLADEDAGLQSALDGFFEGLNAVNADPASLTTRQTFISSAQTLVSRFQILQGEIDTQYDYVNSKVSNYVDSVNSYAQQIAQVNWQIITAESINNQPPNDLYDQRDYLISELNKVVGVQTTVNSNGSVNVFFGNGQQLVVGTSASKLAAVQSSSDPARLTVGIVNTGGVQELPESIITGGALSGVLQFRSETLDSAANTLGQIAASLALTFNAQQALGQDLLSQIDGDAGFVADFFNIGSPVVLSNANNPAGTAEVTASYTPASLSDDGTFYTNLMASDYQLVYDGATFTLTRLADNVAWSGASIAALNAAIDSSPQGSQGFTLASTGTFVAGSGYLIQPTRNVAKGIEVNPTLAADVRQIAIATPVFAEANSANTGTAAITAGSVEPGYTAPAAGSPVTLTYSGGSLTGFNYPVTVTVNGAQTTYTGGAVPYTNGATYSFDGISFSISGSPGNGDTFTIARNSNGVSDNRNGLLLAQMQTGKTMAGNTGTYLTVYGQLVSKAGNKGAEIKTLQAAQETVLSEAQKARDSISAVNLDEEAVNLIEYQQYYQAAAKVLQIASELFDSILAIA
ncbi:MAG: flagellar hook-associated protein FlgK [Candidatus Accumulibacter sp.]|jgi:flagellar hook-associated protein 1 FlgK|nr:flagellar hook-associated protein FlgK [Accumulibacter sp.]